MPTATASTIRARPSTTCPRPLAITTRTGSTRRLRGPSADRPAPPRTAGLRGPRKRSGLQRRRALQPEYRSHTGRGVYNGSLCPRSGHGVFCSRDLVEVRQSIVLVLSSTAQRLNVLAARRIDRPSTATDTLQEGFTYDIHVADLYNNPPGKGTTLIFEGTDDCEIAFPVSKESTYTETVPDLLQKGLTPRESASTAPGQPGADASRSEPGDPTTEVSPSPPKVTNGFWVPSRVQRAAAAARQTRPPVRRHATKHWGAPRVRPNHSIMLNSSASFLLRDRPCRNSRATGVALSRSEKPGRAVKFCPVQFDKGHPPVAVLANADRPLADDFDAVVALVPRDVREQAQDLFPAAFQNLKKGILAMQEQARNAETGIALAGLVEQIQQGRVVHGRGLIAHVTQTVQGIPGRLRPIGVAVGLFLRGYHREMLSAITIKT